MRDIFKQIRMERDDFLTNEVEVVDGYNFSQYNTLKKIHLYYNSQYEGTNYDIVNGVSRKRDFHNISVWRCEVATKMIDMDMNNMTLVAKNPDTDLNVSILEEELHAELKRSKFGKILNEISRKLPIYGSCVLEKTKDSVRLVDLRYMYNDQTAETLADADYVNFRYLLSHKDLRKMALKGWENVQEAIDKFSGTYKKGYDINSIDSNSDASSLFYDTHGTNAPKADAAPVVECWYRYGQVPLSWFTDLEKDENEYVLAKFIVAGVDNPIKNEEGVVLDEDGVILYKEIIDELPFKEVHYKKTEGRWLGIGIVETLFEEQRRINKIKNFESHAMELASVQVFQTKSKTSASNILTDLEVGDILSVKEFIEPIATESRNTAMFNNATQEIEQQADNLTFSRDVVSGENAPSSATLGAIQIQTQQTTAVFDYKRENIGLFWSEYVTDLVFPELESKLNKEHVLRITGSYAKIEKLRNNIATNYARSKVIDNILNTPDYTPSEQLYNFYKEEALEELQKAGSKVWAKVWKDFFKNIEYEVDVETTGESTNVFANIQNASALLQSVDESMLQNPLKKQILFKLMSNIGWRISDLEQIEAKTNEQLLSAAAINNQQPNGQGTESGTLQSNKISGILPAQTPAQ